MCSNVSPNNSLECNSITITALSERIRLAHMDEPICDQEFSALNRKLESKSEALRILRKKLEQSCNERDEFKLMAESLQLRYAMKGNSALDVPDCRDKSSVAALLHGTRERNFKLSIELDGLKQKLKDVNSDLEILRNSREKILPALPERSMFSCCNQNRIKKWEQDRQLLISQLEALKLENVTISTDMKFLIDEKEEILKERDAYRCKAHRLNHELFTALKTNQHQPVIDVDSLLLENNYLHECLKNQELELQTARENIDKYKTMLESQSNKNSKKNYTENMITETQVKQVIDSCLDLPTKTETINDLKELCIALFDKLNDNNVALCHQKNANKMLGKKITELEQRLQLLAGITEPNTEQYFSLSQLLLEGSSPGTINSNSSSPTREVCANQDSIQSRKRKSFSESSETANMQAVNSSLSEFCAEIVDKQLETYTQTCFERETSNENDRESNGLSACSSPIDHKNCECRTPECSKTKTECREFVRTPFDEDNCKNVNQNESNVNSDESSFFVCHMPSDMKNLQDMCECVLLECSSDVHHEINNRNNGSSPPSSDRHESRSPEASTNSELTYKFSDSTDVIDFDHIEDPNTSNSIHPIEKNNEHNKGSSDIYYSPCTYNANEAKELCREALGYKESETSFLFQILGSTEELNKNKWSKCISTTPRQSIKDSLAAAENKLCLNEDKILEYNPSRLPEVETNYIVPDNAKPLDPEQQPIDKAKDTNSTKSISRKKRESKERSSSVPNVKPKKSISNAHQTAKTKSNQTRHTGKSKRLSRRSTATKSVDNSKSTTEQSTDPSKNIQRLIGGSTLIRSKSVSHSSQTDKPYESSLQKTLNQQANSILSAPSLGSYEKFSNYENLLDVRNFIDNILRSKHVACSTSTIMNPFGLKSSKSEPLLLSDNELKDKTNDNNMVKVIIPTSQEIGRSNFEEMRKEKNEQKTIENKDLEIEEELKSSVEIQQNISNNPSEIAKCQYAQDTSPCKKKEQQNPIDSSSSKLVKRRKKRCSCSREERISGALYFTDCQEHCSKKDFREMDSIKFSGTRADLSSSSSCDDCKIKDELVISRPCRSLQPNPKLKKDLKPKTNESKDCKQSHTNIIILPFHNAKDNMEKNQKKKESSLNSSQQKASKTKATKNTNMNKASSYVDPPLSKEVYEKEASKGLHSDDNTLSMQTREISIEKCLYDSTPIKHISGESFSLCASNHPLKNLLRNLSSESECEQQTFKESFERHSPRASKQSDFESLTIESRDELVFTSASSESGHSSASSVYSEVKASKTINSMKTDNMYSRHKAHDAHSQYMHTSIERERLAELSDLPPDIARICLQNLRELDEFDDKVNSADKGCGTCPSENECSCTLLQRKIKRTLNLVKHQNYADDDTDI